MGWVIRDRRIIWWGAGGLDPRGSLIRGPPTTLYIEGSQPIVRFRWACKREFWQKGGIPTACDRLVPWAPPR